MDYLVTILKKNLEDLNGDLECFTKRMKIKKIMNSKICKNINKIQTYKVAYPKAVKSGGIPYTKSQLFIMNPNQICTETYMVITNFISKSKAEIFLNYLNTDFVRFLISLKKITQDITKETWSLVPYFEEQNNHWTDTKLFEYFDLNKKEQNYIKKQADKWKT